MNALRVWHVALGTLALMIVLAIFVARSQNNRGAPPPFFTVGDIRAVHAEVTVSGRPTQGERRLSDGDSVATGPDGRARVRLDDGTLVAIDGATRFTLHGNRLSLETGRLFVQGGPLARTEVALGNATTLVSSSAVAFESKGEAAKIYCAQGELVVNSGVTTRVASGETAVIEKQGVRVAPEKAFDDWTGGLAVPWTGPLGDKSAIPVILAGNGGADPGAPLVVRAHKLSVSVDGELAVSHLHTTYFNGSVAASRAVVRLALPPGAILTRVSRRSGATVTDATLAVAASPSRTTAGAWPGIEWAGGGWLQGDLGSVASGDTLELDLEYSEWLPTRDGRSTYRFPMAGGDEPAIIGELGAELDATRAQAAIVSASAGAMIAERKVTFRRADARPTGDLVVELAPRLVRENAARAYVMADSGGGDPYVMLRTEVPDKVDPGLTLAVVLDTSMSVGAATLEVERAVLDAVLEGLGPRDSIVVLAADQTVAPVGPDSPKPVTAELRAQIGKALAAARPGGASNIGLALQRAADILDAPSRGEQAGSGLVVYVGDGRPSVGELEVERIRRLVSRRAGGIPRLSAVPVGPGADRWMLAKLVAGVGSVYEVSDQADAARAGAALLADALEPTLRDVDLDLGPTVDRIYPREAHAALAGSTVTVIGRLRGELPTRVGFRYRAGTELVQEQRMVYRTSLPRGADLPRRWAQARIEDLAARDEGIEPAIALAVEAKLLTPWTSWFFSSPPDGQSSRPFAQRVLELSAEFDTAYAGRIDDDMPAGSTLLEPPRRFGGGVSLAEAAEIAVKRILQQASSAVRACRDARVAVRPETPRTFVIDLSVDGGGHATRVVVSLGDARQRDPALERCIQGVVQSLPYFAAGVPINLTQSLTVPESRTARRTQCSGASKVALPIRREIWRARALLDADAYALAAQSCELRTWTDRRAFLLLALDLTIDGAARLQIASDLEAAGETDAAAFVRKEALRRVSTFAELEQLSELLMASEPEIDDELDKAYKAAGGDTARLAVVRRFLLLAPHNALARRRLLALLEALGDRDALVRQIELMRAEPFIDAGLLAQGASALRRVGLDGEGRRAFGELLERAPQDPWTLAYVGDRLRAEGMYDEAESAYASLERAVPGDASVALRMALAHAGAGRVDVATRLLDRVTQTGGRGDDGRLGELASITEAVLLAGARVGSDAETDAQLVRRLVQTPLADVAGLVMVQMPPSDDPIEVSVTRDRGEQRPESADLDARALGLAAIRIERGEGPARILLSRKAEPGPSRPMTARVAALVLTPEHTPALVTRDVEVRADGKPVELRFDGGTLL